MAGPRISASSIPIAGTCFRNTRAKPPTGCSMNHSTCIRTGGNLALMQTARKLLHTRYRVNELEKTVKFYKEVLGLAEIRRHKSPRGSELVFMKAPESEEL